MYDTLGKNFLCVYLIYTEPTYHSAPNQGGLWRRSLSDNKAGNGVILNFGHNCPSGRGPRDPAFGHIKYLIQTMVGPPAPDLKSR